MKEKIVNTKDITRDEWLSYRKLGIGGSDASTILGLNPYKSRLELYADKLGILPEKEDTEAMRVGRDLEQYVSERFCEATGKTVKRNNFMWRSSENPFMLADIDREIIGENAGLECKTTSAWNKSDFENGEIPLTYYVQCMHYISVMEYDRMYLAVLVLQKGFYWFIIERNDDEIKALIPAEKEFYQLIQDRKEPEPDGSESANRAIKALSNKNSETDQIINLFELSNDVEELANLSEEASSIEKKIEEKKQKIKLFMKEYSQGQTSLYNVYWKSQTKNCIDSKLLKTKYPNIYSECSKKSDSRVFRIQKRSLENE